jgi:hypothetical protein
MLLTDIFVLSAIMFVLFGEYVITSSAVSGKMPPSQIVELDQLPLALIWRKAIEKSPKSWFLVWKAINNL